MKKTEMLTEALSYLLRRWRGRAGALPADRGELGRTLPYCPWKAVNVLEIQLVLCMLHVSTF